jgi:alpha-D-ribose 1-methylphosphonate 5-triphosphate synthase subunit PhnL
MQAMTLKTFDIGKGWKLEMFYYEHARRVRFMVTDGYYCDYPILYDDGITAAWDNPYRIRQSIRQAAKLIMMKARRIGLYGKEIDKETAERLAAEIPIQFNM